MNVARLNNTMKQGWEVKKLGEVCTILMGQSPSSDTYNDLGKGLPFFQGNADFGRVHPSVRVYCNAPIRIADVDDILISVRAPIGAINITNTKCCIGRGLAAIKNGNRIKKSFAYHALIANKDKLIALGTGSTFKSIGRVALNDLLIPVPPIDEQENIVAELDCLSGIIEKKKQQLKEYDALAQSIFYEMFGNPIDNEKGWETSELKNVSTLLNGRAYKQNELLSAGKYKVLRVGNFFTNGNYYYSDLELEEDKYCDNGDLLFAWSASFGAFIWNEGKVIYHYHIWKVLYDKNVLDIQYYKYLLNTMTNFFMKDVHGIGMVHLTKVGMEQYILPLPPLALQQEFASKIEAIEMQKELIKQSIAETETLFNSRMDYYFN